MLPIRWVSRDEMLSNYIAKFSDPKGSDKGLPNSDIESHHKYIMPISQAMSGVKDMLKQINKGELPMLKTGPKNHKGQEASKANHMPSSAKEPQHQEDEKSILITTQNGGFGG